MRDTRAARSPGRGRMIWTLSPWFARRWPLLAIVAVGLALRAYAVTTTPSELIADELDLYNSAHSIATTGHDVDGSLLPFLASSFTRNPPMYALAELVSSLVFGTGPLGLRLPAILFGTSCIALMHGIAFELTRRRDIAIVTAALFATQPIFIHFSRIAWEPASELPFLLAGAYLVLRAIRESEEQLGSAASERDLPLGAIVLAATCYTYMAGWFYAVALGLPLGVLAWRRARSRRAHASVLGAFILFMFCAMPALWMWFGNTDTYARTERIAVFGHGFTLAALRQFTENYVAHFRWSYLVATGDPQAGSTWRYLNGFGAFYWWVVPLALLGFVVAPRFVRAPWAAGLLAWWLAIYPLGGALTNEGIPNAPRTLAGAPVFCVFASIGFAALVALAARLRQPMVRHSTTFALRAAFAVNASVSVALFYNYYLTKFDYVEPNAWDSGTRELFGAIHDNASGNQRLCFSVRQGWYNTETYVRYYLGDTSLLEIDRVDDARCFLAGTLLATDAPVPRPGFRVIANVSEIGGAHFAVLAERRVDPR